MPLGRGLNALLPSKNNKTKFSNEEINEIDEKNKFFDIEIGKIQLNPHQPRKRFDRTELEDLINSIKIHGIIQPLIVTKLTDGKYQLIAGERRLRAAQLLNQLTVPAIIREVKELEKLEIALIENLQRKNLNALEEALSYKRLMDEFNLTQEEISYKIGKKRSTIANTLRLLALPEDAQKAILDEKISEGHARTIASLDDEKQQLELLKKILRNQMTVREAEDQVKKVRVKSYTRSSVVNPVVAERELALRDIFGQKVIIKNKGKGGEIIIHFQSQEDFNEIYKKLVD